MPETSTTACDPSKFCSALAALFEVKDLGDVPVVTDQPPVRLPRVTIDDPYAITDHQKAVIAREISSRFSAVGLQTTAPPPSAPGRTHHPLVALGTQLRDVVPSANRMRQAIEAPDGTGKVFDTGDPLVLSRSNRAMSAHQDGFGSGARVKLVGLWADRVGITNPRTFVQNLLRVAIDLKRADEPAFRALFAPDAITIRRATDGVTVVSPILFLSRAGAPRVFFRAPGPDYDVLPPTSSAGRRGLDYLLSFSRIDAPGSAHIELAPAGTGILFDNHVNVHGRTSFVNGAHSNQTRVLAVATWAESGDHSPGVVGRNPAHNGARARSQQPRVVRTELP